MKFKKDEKIYDTIEEAHEAFKCPDLCGVDCPLNPPSWAHERRSRGHLCDAFVEDKPLEAALMMGYEVVVEGDAKCKTCINDYPGVECVNCGTKHWNYRPKKEEEDMENTKPISEWTLGEVKDYCNKTLACGGCKFTMLCNNNAADWNLTDPPRFTDAELEQVRALAVLFGDKVSVSRGDKGHTLVNSAVYNNLAWYLPSSVLPSLKVGEEIVLKDHLGGE